MHLKYLCFCNDEIYLSPLLNQVHSVIHLQSCLILLKARQRHLMRNRTFIVSTHSVCSISSEGFSLSPGCPIITQFYNLCPDFRNFMLSYRIPSCMGRHDSLLKVTVKIVPYRTIYYQNRFSSPHLFISGKKVDDASL